MIGFAVITAILWGFTAVFLLGRGENLVAGYNVLSKEEKLKYKEKHDISARNKYVGKALMLPMSLIFSAVLAAELLGISDFISSPGNLNVIEPLWITVLVLVVIITHCTHVVIQLNSDRFKK